MTRLLVGAGIALLAFILVSLWARRADRPDALGVHAGQLLPCPDSPNCVSTHAASTSERMPPLRFTDSPAAAQQRILAAIRRMPRTTVVTDEPGYVAAEFRTPVFGFIDDVEFLIHGEAGVIHFRSASRLGYSDLGVNRRRMTRFRELYESLSASAHQPGATR
jgi:uncharacterized protein (DUF1499 family)